MRTLLHTLILSIATIGLYSLAAPTPSYATDCCQFVYKDPQDIRHTGCINMTNAEASKFCTSSKCDPKQVKPTKTGKPLGACKHVTNSKCLSQTRSYYAGNCTKSAGGSEDESLESIKMQEGLRDGLQYQKEPSLNEAEVNTEPTAKTAPIAEEPKTTYEKYEGTVKTAPEIEEETKEPVEEKY